MLLPASERHRSHISRCAMRRVSYKVNKLRIVNYRIIGIAQAVRDLRGHQVGHRRESEALTQSCDLCAL